MATISRYGVWLRAGLDGSLAGLDLNQAMASLPDGLDRDFARRLFVIAEGATVPAVRALAKNAKD